MGGPRAVVVDYDEHSGKCGTVQLEEVVFVTRSSPGWKYVNAISL